ncbi:hypothetical protein ERO13_A07G194200v2 [Gossypium hirsutum]|uniref:Uncharacterized protein n=4 Tax=Gossypium TaxID=3633 RepID=A0A2P5XKU5_GOSBA|nr:hypothetical protein ES319_A07G211200v1 [Gossypium barbadense]KAG4193014.1 hypothetical protein ERO13_A07G194200v2 [Gossypium hirsutum]KAK5820063.1 hypothetical protein PVK06_025108 [Gossypium arboreum]PPS03969.1 hypothetical protein GOBAR_AA16700 [Gossypium barbadense]TYH11068.1 hypothetical protein ES288_A07G229200v1 [Gossypium darwinii]
MKRVWKNNKVVFSLLMVTILLSMATSGSLLAEAKIPNFSAIQDSLKSGIQRRNLRPLPPGGGTSPIPNPPYRQEPPARYK